MNHDDEMLRTAYANLERLTIEQAVALSPRFDCVADLMDEGVTINHGPRLDIEYGEAIGHGGSTAGNGPKSLWVSRDDIALAEFGALTGSVV